MLCIPLPDPLPSKYRPFYPNFVFKGSVLFIECVCISCVQVLLQAIRGYQI